MTYEIFVAMPVRLRYLIFDRSYCGLIVAWCEFVIRKAEQVILARQVLLWFSAMGAYRIGDKHLSHEITATRLLWFWARNTCVSGNRCLSHEITASMLIWFWLKGAYLSGDRCLWHEITTSMFMWFWEITLSSQRQAPVVKIKASMLLWFWATGARHTKITCYALPNMDSHQATINSRHDL